MNNMDRRVPIYPPNEQNSLAFEQPVSFEIMEDANEDSMLESALQAD